MGGSLSGGRGRGHWEKKGEGMTMRGMSHAAHARLAHSAEEAARGVAAPAIPRPSPKKKTPSRLAWRTIGEKKGNCRNKDRNAGKKNFSRIRYDPRKQLP